MPKQLFANLTAVLERLNNPNGKNKAIRYTLQDLTRTEKVCFSSAGMSEELNRPSGEVVREKLTSFFGHNAVIQTYIEENANQHNFACAARTELKDRMFAAKFLSQTGEKEDISLEFSREADGSILVTEKFSLPKSIFKITADEEMIEHVSDENIATSTLVTRIREKEGVITHEIESFVIIPGASQKSKEICNLLFSSSQLQDLKQYAQSEINTAVQTRGLSFIAAAKLVIANLSPEDSQKINAYPKDKFPIRHALMAGASPEFQQKIKDKTNAELIAYYLAMLEKHWKKPAILQPKYLAALEKELIELVRDNVYVGEQGVKFEQIKKELEDAENHVCWKPRETQSCSCTEPTGTRTEKPVAIFTPAQTTEWLSILESGKNKQPKWFTALPAWEQKYLKDKVQAWQGQQIVENLGEFLGSVPTTIRRYPGAANAYKTNYTATGGHGPQTFYKVRTGYLVPFDVKDFDEKVKIAKQNIEQLLAVSVSDYIDSERKRLGLNVGDPLTISMPLLIQTLHSPPFQPGGRGNNAALFKAIDQIQAKLTGKDAKPQIFLKKIGVIVPNNVVIDKIEILSSNRPVNSARGIAAFFNFFSRQARENDKTLDSLNAYLDLRAKSSPDDHGIKMAQAAMQALRAQSNFANTYSLNNLLAKLPGRVGKFFQPKANTMAERAALEQIVASKVGIRIGSCVSGKDREEMVTEMALAMTEFYAKYGKMPPPVNCKKVDEPLRLEYEQTIAQHFLSGHGQKLAGENAAGCNGLKNVEDVFGGRICASIASLAQKRAIPDDPIKTTQKIAGINKLGKKKVTDDSLDLVRSRFITQAINSYAGEIVAAIGSNSSSEQTQQTLTITQPIAEKQPEKPVAVALPAPTEPQLEQPVAGEQQQLPALSSEEIAKCLARTSSLLVSFNGKTPTTQSEQMNPQQPEPTSELPTNRP